MNNIFAIIGGSGFDPNTFASVTERRALATPYGEISAPLQICRALNTPFVFLPRHGIPHRIPPHRINYRANLWALREQGCRRVVAVNTVGGIGAAAQVGAVVVPDQIIDYTHGREHTYSDGLESPLQHIDFTHPYQAELREALLAAAASAGIAVVAGGVYGVTQGPRLESAAEIGRMQRDGCDLVGMTGMPEAALARELGLDYAALCLVVNLAAGRGGPLSVEAMRQIAAQGMESIGKIIGALLAV